MTKSTQPRSQPSASRESLLAGEEFEHETFEGLDLHEAELRDKEFVGCTFRNLKLQQSRWKGSRLEDCVFEGCDLSSMLPSQLALRGVKLERCKMLGIDWSDIGAYPVFQLTDCNASYCSFVGMAARKMSFVRCVLLEANFIRCDLTESSFEACQLAGARFEQCGLERVSFGDCRDLLLEPGGNRLRGASIPLDAAVRLAESFGLKITGV